MKLFGPVAGVALSAMLLAACAGDPPLMQSNETVTVLDLQELPSPPSAQGVAHLGALDKIGIQIFGVPELTREVQVDAGGGISFPFVGTLDVEGRTAAEVEQMIADGLRDGYLKDPVVSVNMLDTASQTIAVEGEVENPGIFPAAGRLSLLRALALAGGATNYALRERVVIFRQIDGMRFAGVYDLEALRSGRIDDPRVYANDLIVLGESPRRRSIDRIIAAAPAFTSPLIILLNTL